MREAEKQPETASEAEQRNIGIFCGYVQEKAPKLFCLFPELEAMGYFRAPASVKYHGAYEGGLFEHSFTVAETLVELTEKLGLKWSRPESPVIIGLFHDLCKCDQYKQLDNDVWMYGNFTLIPGHGEKSVIYAQKLTRLTDEEIACIRWHMGSYETDTKMWEYYDRAIRKYSNVLYTHMADMIASKIKDI